MGNKESVNKVDMLCHAMLISISIAKLSEMFQKKKKIRSGSSPAKGQDIVNNTGSVMYAARPLRSPALITVASSIMTPLLPLQTSGLTNLCTANCGHPVTLSDKGRYDLRTYSRPVSPNEYCSCVSSWQY